MSENNIELFEKMPIPKAVLTMAVPTIIGQLIVLIYNMADTFFVGRTGNPNMVAGASLILPIFNITISLSNLAGMGGGSLISRLLGAKETQEAGKVYTFSIWLALFSSTVFSLVVLTFMKPLLLILGATNETFLFAKQYATCVLVLGAIPTVLNGTLANLLRCTGESKKAGFGVTMGGIINIVLDPLVMFIIMPEGMEMIGAGLATFVSNCISCSYFIIVIKKLNNPVLSLQKPGTKPERKNLKSLFGVGVPSAVATFLFDLDYIVLDKLMSGYGNYALAAIGIVLKAERLPLNVGVGICQGMMPVVAYNYSAKNFKRMNGTKRFALLLGLSVAAISIIMYELFASSIMHFFINDLTTVAYGTTFLRIRCLATPLMFMCFFHIYLFNGFGQGMYSLFLAIVRWLGFNIPMLYLLNSIVGMNGLAWAQVFADILTVLLSFVVYKRYEKQKLFSSL